MAVASGRFWAAWLLMLMLILTVISGCQGSGPVERNVALRTLPAEVRVNAISAVPGLELARARIRDDGVQPVYVLEGYADANAWRIECALSGSVLRIDRLP